MGSGGIADSRVIGEKFVPERGVDAGLHRLKGRGCSGMAWWRPAGLRALFYGCHDAIAWRSIWKAERRKFSIGVPACAWTSDGAIEMNMFYLFMP